jgi:hypothetical protein
MAKPFWRQYFDGDHNDELAVRAPSANGVFNATHIRLICSRSGKAMVDLFSRGGIVYFAVWVA